MEQKRLFVDGEILWTGVRKASARSGEPILCLFKSEKVVFVAVSGLRLVVSWEARLRQPSLGGLALVMPPAVADLLSCEAVRSQARVEIAVRGEKAILRLVDHLGKYEVCWKSDLSSFPAPDEFSSLIKVPQVLMDVSYLKISDAAHQAVAKLIQMESKEQIDRTRLAVLISLDFGRLSIDGQEIVGIGKSQYYFDPRLVIRALEFVKERTIRLGLTPLRGGQAFLSLVVRQDEWTAHCSLLSIGKETQMLYPLPVGRNQ